MIDSFMSLDTMLQGYWVLALVSSLIFVIQAIGTFVGFDTDADADLGGDADFDAEGFHIVSVKTIVCFVLGFGWTGVLFWNTIENRLWLSLLAFVIGLCFMFTIALLLHWVLKLDKDNTFHTEQVVGKTADVYLRIPAARADSGKVLVSLNGSNHELEAITDDAEAIPTGAKVEIISTIRNSTLLVKKI